MGGGSTANLLALWRLHGLDVILRECWEAGVVLKGVSAGSLCWHVGGTTDSFGPTLVPVTNGLAFLPYSNSPHHDAEEQRRPLIHRLIAEGTLPDGYATENGTGLVFFGTELQDAFTEVEGKLAYSLTRDGDDDPRDGARHPGSLRSSEPRTRCDAAGLRSTLRRRRTRAQPILSPSVAQPDISNNRASRGRHQVTDASCWLASWKVSL